MGKNSIIEWCEHTFNPWTGCAKVSAGCANCYAETLSRRFGWSEWGPNGTRKRTSAAIWKAPLAWNRAAARTGERARVFCASLADVFEDRPELAPWREDLWQLVEATPNLCWLLLTKRPENIRAMLPRQFPNVWLGTSAEDQVAWDRRLPLLLDVPASVHFVSAEPLLGPVSMGAFTPDWLIVGGESGPHARPMDAAWVRSLRDECTERGTAFFFKQWGGPRKKEAGRLLDGRTWDEFPANREGGNL